MNLLGILLLAIIASCLSWRLKGHKRTWALLTVSVLTMYLLQPATTIRNLSFWLPTASLVLVLFTWRISIAPKPLDREDLWTVAFFIVMAVGIALTRILPDSLPLGALRPPAFPILAAALLATALGFALLEGVIRRGIVLTGLASVVIILLFLGLKTPSLAEWISRGLRAVSGQSVVLASSGDLPWLGFSYLAFRLLHTLRDRARGLLPPVSLREYATYVFFFPALSAGPIDRLERFLADLRQPVELNEALIGSAGRRLLIGIFKKFVLADFLALFALNALNAGQIQSTSWGWVVLYAYSFRLYLDFSGYTDIAIGIGILAGIRLPENFAQPYLKSNLSAFWNSWHITLAQWFRSYFFNPLTRALRSKAQGRSAVLIILIGQLGTMLLIGLWHGVTWNFALWGLWHGLGLFLHNRWSAWRKASQIEYPFGPGLERGLGVLFTFHFVTLGWVWFVLPEPSQSLRFFGRLFAGGL